MRIATIGSGYVGLVSGACFSEFGTEVICVDKDVARIEGLKAGRIPKARFDAALPAISAENAGA